MERITRYFTPAKAIGFVALATSLLNGLLTWADGAERAGQIAAWNWSWVFHPAVILATAAVGFVWILFVGPPRQPSGMPAIPHKGLRWRWRSNGSRTSVNPYPFCPKHDVPLLWEAYDKTKASWQRLEVEAGMWFSRLDNGRLYCPSGGGHVFDVSNSARWMAQQASQEAASLLEPQMEKLRLRHP